MLLSIAFGACLSAGKSLWIYMQGRVSRTLSSSQKVINNISCSYIPYPWHKPTQCICPKPLKECNGKCGNYHSCPSSHAKRDIQFGSDHLCSNGLTACGIPGRGGRTWECLDTQHELESCTLFFVPGQATPRLTSIPRRRWVQHPFELVCL
jgi:hypothetical protein